MGDSSSFTSLFALVDNHLSKTNLQQDKNTSDTSGISSLKIPAFTMSKGMSDTRLITSSIKFPIPSTSMSEHPISRSLPKPFGNIFNPSDSDDDEDDVKDQRSKPAGDDEIKDVLVRQLENMFKAREAKEEEEKRKAELKKAEEDLRKLELTDSDCLIDLMPAVQLPGQAQPQPAQPAVSSSSSVESMHIPDSTECMDDESIPPIADLKIASRPPSPLLPITQDMRYILKHKIGRPSAFGKVLCARYRPVAQPYLRVRINNPNIKVFDFSTPSPDDIALDRLRRPTFYNKNTLSAFE